MATQAIDGLPLHLISLILSHFSDFRSLGAAILSHTSFYHAFQDSSDRLITDVLLNQIPLQSLGYAFALFSAKCLENPNLDRIEKFLADRVHNQSFMHRFWSTKISPIQAAALSKTHHIIDYFTQDLAREMLPLAQQHLGLEHRRQGALSPSEIFRIHRALYLFQIYRLLFFGDKRNLRLDGERLENFDFAISRGFFGGLSPWVSEQLACIHDYLERVMSRGFDQVAAHDIRWGKLGVDWVSLGRASEHRQAYLSFGLGFLFALDQAQSYDECFAVLQYRRSAPPRTKHMLAYHFKYAPPGFADEDLQFVGPMETWSQNQLNREARKSIDGPDDIKSNAYRMWFEAHKKYSPGCLVHHEHHAVLRRCGYVLWDAPEQPLNNDELRTRFEEPVSWLVLNEKNATRHCSRRGEVGSAEPSLASWVRRGTGARRMSVG